MAATFFQSALWINLKRHPGIDVATVMIIALPEKGSDGVTFVRWTARGVGILWGVIIGALVIGGCLLITYPACQHVQAFLRL